MTVEPISDPTYWARRLRLTQEADRHRAIFVCPTDRWRRIEAKHRDILAGLIAPPASILDAGCGWGRLLTLLPENWHGDYLGVDLSPDFIAMARKENPHRRFKIADLREPLPEKWFAWGVLISVRPMVVRNLGQEVWDGMEVNLRKAAKRLVYLEYDENDPGSVE